MNALHENSKTGPACLLHRGFQSLAIALLVLGGGLESPVAKAGDTALPRFVTHVSTPIDCESSPFGGKVSLGWEAEMMEVLVNDAGPDNGPVSHLNVFQFDHQTEALTPWLTDGSGFYIAEVLDVIDIDLNGDGREEAVIATRSVYDTLRLFVMGRDASGNPDLFDSYEASGAFDKVELAAGDFDGSTDHHQELAVLKQTNAGLEAYILTGNDSGGIAEANDTYSGYWERNNGFQNVSMASGDFLLDGRDQIVVSYDFYSPTLGYIAYYVLEFESEIPDIMSSGPNDIAMGNVHFYHTFDTAFLTDDPSHNPTLDNIMRMELQAGNVVDSAAAELVEFIHFADGEASHLGMRLHHFITSRDANNRITGISFARREGVGRDFDSSIVIANSYGAPTEFAATIANIDAIAPGEIVLSRTEASTQRLSVLAYTAKTDLVAGFTYVTSNLFVQFDNTSTGENIVSRSWDFGDGSDPVHVMDPSHEYAAAGSYDVTLQISSEDNETRTYTTELTVGPGSSSGGVAVPYMYLLEADPAYQDYYDALHVPTMVDIAAEDMDADGITEIMTVAKTADDILLRSTWHVAGTTPVASLVGTHDAELDAAYESLTTLGIAAVDFDGDSLRASVGSDCRTVEEPQVRQLVWLPPYFTKLQDNADKQAAFGRRIESGSDVEQRAGSFTSHDVSGYVGLTVGDAAYGIEATVKATAGQRYQSSSGEIHGNGYSFEVGQGYIQNQGEALVVLEENSFRCYSYEVTTEIAGSVPDSGIRMCERIEGSEQISGTDAVSWDTDIAAGSPDHPPAQWVPLHRDWQSMSLFRPVSSNAAFAGGAGAEKATDGMFSTASTATAASLHPYLQIDLGEVRDISNIRVFPASGEAAELAGFRLYTSSSPMLGSAIPAGPAVEEYEPMTADDAVYDRWDAWTRDRNNPEQMLKARYIRLQHPGTAHLQIAEIQVFGEVHAEPTAYPNAVCDADVDDKYFLARVWDSVHQSFRNIEVRGQLLWDGTGGPWPSAMACTNDGELLAAPIWSNAFVGSSATSVWNVGDDNRNLTGDVTSFENSTYVGAEFDLTAGFVAAVTTGAAYQFATGITGDFQTTSYWSEGLELGGAIGGFANEFGDLVDECEYNPRPYAYHLRDRSITGYQHDIYVVDYIVRQGPGTWQRGNVPVLCSRADAIFANGFD